MANFWCNFLPILIGVGSAILGGLIGWFMRRPRIEELTEVIETQEANYLRLKNSNDTLTIRNNNLQDSYNSIYANYQKMQADYEELETNKSALVMKYNGLERLKNTQINDLNTQITEWREAYEALHEKYETANNKLMSVETTEDVSAEQYSQLRGQYETLAKELEAYKKTKNADVKDLNEQLDLWRDSYESLLDKHEQLNGRVKNNEEQLEEWRMHYETLLAEKDEQQERMAALENSVQNSVPVADNTQELSTLKTTNEELEARLSSLSRRYQDISYEKEGLERIISSLNTELASYRYRNNPDDLKLIEGIGPKIEELLNNAGIWKFSQLAEIEPSKIQDILTNAGPRFVMHDPETWGVQANLAHKGEWEKLKELQNHLVGGVDKSSANM